MHSLFFLIMIVIKNLLAVCQNPLLLRSLTARELQERVAGSTAGWLWLWIQPIITIIIYYIVFDFIFAAKINFLNEKKNVGVFLIAGMLVWLVFVDGLMRTGSSIINTADLLKKNNLPIIYFPLKNTLASYIIFAPLVIILYSLYFPLHKFWIGAPFLIVIFVLQFLITFMLGYILAILAVASRDALHVASLLMSIGGFISPAIYPAEMIPPAYRWVIFLNPMSPYIEIYQRLFLFGRLPNFENFSIMACWFFVTYCVLNYIIKNSRKELIDWL